MMQASAICEKFWVQAVVAGEAVVETVRAAPMPAEDADDDQSGSDVNGETDDADDEPDSAPGVTSQAMATGTAAKQATRNWRTWNAACNAMKKAGRRLSGKQAMFSFICSGGTQKRSRRQFWAGAAAEEEGYGTTAHLDLNTALSCLLRGLLNSDRRVRQEYKQRLMAALAMDGGLPRPAGWVSGHAALWQLGKLTFEAAEAGSLALGVAYSAARRAELSAEVAAQLHERRASIQSQALRREANALIAAEAEHEAQQRESSARRVPSRGVRGSSASRRNASASAAVLSPYDLSALLSGAVTQLTEAASGGNLLHAVASAGAVAGRTLQHAVQGGRGAVRESQGRTTASQARTSSVNGAARARPSRGPPGITPTPVATTAALPSRAHVAPALGAVTAPVHRPAALNVVLASSSSQPEAGAPSSNEGHTRLAHASQSQQTPTEAAPRPTGQIPAQLAHDATAILHADSPGPQPPVQQRMIAAVAALLAASASRSASAAGLPQQSSGTVAATTATRAQQVLSNLNLETRPHGASSANTRCDVISGVAIPSPAPAAMANEVPAAQHLVPRVEAASQNAALNCNPAGMSGMGGAHGQSDRHSELTATPMQVCDAR
jgi:hypothetical protein